MKSPFAALFLLMTLSSTFAQDHYQSIPDYSNTAYSNENILARMLDGLGFRYYWGTYELRAEDLAFKPSDEARTSYETLQHIDGLTFVILKTIKGEPIKPGQNNSELEYTALRQKTLQQIEDAAEYLKNNTLDPGKHKIRFQNGESEYSLPLWNLINGPIEDATWHVGQIVSFRRSSENPLPKGVDVLEGVKK
ncbi:hypothetical protein LAG90_05390 [Marinilongibacter aquaticus]|uniref:DinB family protein n=1 Tax=Marinilongibacter aquaticus TaxID=2975157 RepID=UPI0021BDA858|nr:hypothetical protein [Marinilongibacter aquaticus]UBM60074.1 hypothetical protein LAG90_05390 [Marinilongibacter aquaticus]